MSDEPHLLPGNSTDQEKAISLATARVGDVPVPVKELWSPMTCPADTLPWLAWALSVDSWSENWSEQRKRAAVASAIMVHQRKGTVGAIRRAIEPLGYDVIIDEDTGEVFTFAVRLVTDAGHPVTLAEQDEAERLALSAKNARSRLVAVSAQTNIPQPVLIGSTALSGEVTTVWPYIENALEPRPRLLVASAQIGAELTDIYPDRGPYAEGQPMTAEPARWAATAITLMHATLTAEAAA